MERLTEYVDGKYIRIKGTKSLYPKNERDGAPLSNAIARLAAYEETGLEPEEIERILDSYGRGMTLRTENAQRLEIIKEIPINRLRELAQAEKEGRLVVLGAFVLWLTFFITPFHYTDCFSVRQIGYGGTAFAKCTVTYRGSGCAALRSTYGVETDPEIITNADRIRGMDDNELAEFLSTKLNDDFYEYPDLTLQWLQQTAEEEV